MRQLVLGNGFANLAHVDSNKVERFVEILNEESIIKVFANKSICPVAAIIIIVVTFLMCTFRL